MEIRGPALDLTTNDLRIDPKNGDMVWVSGSEAIAQEIQTRLLLFRGEYFLDLREGVPYWQEILRKNPDLDRVRSIFRRAILSVPSVIDVPKLDLDLDRSTRTLTVVWEVRADDGRTIRSSDFGPLILDIAS